jgi:hypothetical protein
MTEWGRAAHRPARPAAWDAVRRPATGAAERHPAGRTEGLPASAHDLAHVSLQPPATPGESAAAVSRTFDLAVLIPRAGHDRDAEEAGTTDQRALVEAPDELVIRESDAVAAALTYAPVISQGGVTLDATDFGVTETSISLAGRSVTPDAAAAAFRVTATVNSRIRWATQSRGRTDIPDENAAAIHQGNYTAVAADLTPNMASDNGRPPRRSYWAGDLTARHERFHATERAETYGRPAFQFASTWLAGQTAADAAEATRLLNQVPAKMNESYAASYSPGKESRAYGDGAPSYRARADAITAKGGRTGYPADPAAPAPAPAPARP